MSASSSTTTSWAYVVILFSEMPVSFHGNELHSRDGDLLLRYHNSKCANPMGQVQNIWYKHYKQPCSIMPNALANSHPVVKNKLRQGKLRTDERRISGCEALDRVMVGGGGWTARRYHGFVILPSHPHSLLLSHIIIGALWTNHSAETDHSSCRGPLWTSRSCRRPFTAPRQNKDKFARGTAPHSRLWGPLGLSWHPHHRLGYCHGSR